MGDGVFRTDNCHKKNIIPAPMTMQNYRNKYSVKNVLSVEKIFTKKNEKKIETNKPSQSHQISHGAF